MSEPITFDVLVQPRASRAKVGPRHDGRIKIAVTAPPVDGEANAAVIELSPQGYWLACRLAGVAKTLGVAKRNVEVIAGATSRRKMVRVTGATLAQLEAAIA